MKTIKIIELLNKIANGEKVPEKITFDKIIWEYNSISYDYINGKNELKLFNELIVFSKGWLNMEVEIIDDEDTIDIQSIEELNDKYTTSVYEVVHKQNEIIRAMKQLDNKIRNK